METASTLSLEEAAAQLGVHYQTAYRWVRSGRLPAAMVNGKYQVDRHDLVAVDDARREPTAPTLPSDDRLDRQCRAMQDALFEGDETRAAKIMRTLIDNGTPVVRLIEDVLVPPMVEIGEAWAQGEASIYTEHRASAIVDRLLATITPNPRGRRRGVAVVAALAGDRHSLPTAMATAALRDDNWTVEHLGADMPIDEIERFLATHDVDLVVLSATGTDAVRRARKAKITLERHHDVRVLVGGQGSLTNLQSHARG
ncbi:MAG: B12-binding domain-containing protein [Acidobacteriota bacterium]